jgi:hypothetical protein
MSDADDPNAKKETKSTDYEVGYGKPPKRTQFRKGTSGNPNGRPKGARGFRTLLREAIQRPIVVREGERTRTVSKVEALIEATLLKALTGDARALHELLPKICELDDDDFATEAGDEALTRDEAEILAGIRDRLLRSLNTEEEPKGAASEQEETNDHGEKESK